MANPKSKEARQAWIDQNPFDGMKIDDTKILDKIDGRNPCPECGKSRKFYCYSCYVPIEILKSQLPIVKLPLKIDIIKHKHEIDGKSTAGHAAILAPEDVTIYTYPDIPDYHDERVVLIYPSQTAVNTVELLTKNYEDLLNLKTVEETPKGYHLTTLLKNIGANSGTIDINQPTELPIQKVVFIDSTWNQSKGIYKDERIRRIPCVVIQNRISQFWRHQKGSPRWYLSTIEALHQFLIEIHVIQWGLDRDYKGITNCFSENNTYSAYYSENSNSYKGQYDNLLFIFKHMYDLIHSYYDHDNLYAYKRRLS